MIVLVLTLQQNGKEKHFKASKIITKFGKGDCTVMVIDENLKDLLSSYV